MGFLRFKRKVYVVYNTYRTFFEGGELTPNDHDDYAWVGVNELNRYDFASADIPFVEQLKGGQKMTVTPDR